LNGFSLRIPALAVLLHAQSATYALACNGQTVFDLGKNAEKALSQYPFH
jgi:hypothetical protein